MMKYPCSYYFCEQCGFLQTEEPYWLNEAYSNAIGKSDTGIIHRNIRASLTLSPIFLFLFGRSCRYLDIAGGYGILTRIMRDKGFDYYWSDKYCENIFAIGFEANEKESYSALSAFEVVEHTANPIEFLSEAMRRSKSKTILFSTVLFESSPPKPDSWWYYAFDGGQHISFYQRKTLLVIAKRLGLHCYSSGSTHLLTDKHVNKYLYGILASRIFIRIASFVIPLFMKSKTMSDYHKLAQH